MLHTIKALYSTIVNIIAELILIQIQLLHFKLHHREAPELDHHLTTLYALQTPEEFVAAPTLAGVVDAALLAVAAASIEMDAATVAPIVSHAVPTAGPPAPQPSPFRTCWVAWLKLRAAD
jgi:hypothetical protein